MSSSRQEHSAPPAPPLAPGTYIDWGPALPDEYGLARITGLVRDPGRFFVFWEGGTAIRVRDLSGGPPREHAVAGTGGGYLEGEPEHEYEVDLLVDGRVVAVSNRIRLPRRDPATAVDPEWVPTAEQLEILRRLAGGLDLLMREEVESANSEVLRRRAGGPGWPTSPGRR